MKTYLAGIKDKPETQDTVDAPTMMDAAETYMNLYTVTPGESITVEADAQTANYTVA